MDNVQKPRSSKNSALQTGMKVSPNDSTVAARLSSSLPQCETKMITSIVDRPLNVIKEEPVVLDLTVYDEYGNRTASIYRRSVKLKFGYCSRLEEPNQQQPANTRLIDYHSAMELADLEPAPMLWKMSLLDDDVITTVMDRLQILYPETLFVNPCLTQCILFAKVKHVSLFLDPLTTKKYSSVFFVLNDSHRPGNNSHHWSLLVYSRQSNRLFHFDSMQNTNYKVAYELAQKLCEYLNVWTITDVRCEQQGNSTDCGYYVIDNMMKLLYMMRSGDQIPLSQIDRLPSLINKTKNFVANLYTRTKMN